MKKPRFNPEITRVKLNPEQAVLSCDCYSGGSKLIGTSPGGDKVKVSGGGLCEGRSLSHWEWDSDAASRRSGYLVGAGDHTASS